MTVTARPAGDRPFYNVEMGLGRSNSIRVESLRDLIEIYDREIVMLEHDRCAVGW